MRKLLANRAALVAVAGLAALAVAIGLVVASRVGSDDSGGGTTTAVAGASEVAALLEGIPQRDNELGRADAPVTLVEYADFQCPYCAEWARNAFPDLVRDYVRSGKLKLVFQGMAFLGPDSERALRLVLSAGTQDKMWHAVDLLFVNQGAENSGWATDDLLRGVAEAVPGLDPQKALDDRNSAEIGSLLAEHIQFAAENGITSTPSFQIGKTGGELRRLDVTSLDAGAMRPAIDELLGE